MQQERDEKGRFLPGNTRGISTEVARDYQARSVAKRKENKLLADVVKAALEKKVSEGSPMTRLEYLAEKAIANHAQGEMTFKDLRELQRILGEDVVNINSEGLTVIISPQAAEAAKKWGQ